MRDSAPLMRGRYAEVIGDPVAHSKSPLIHNFWLEQLGLTAEYRTTRVTPGDLAAYVRERKTDPDWLGCSVTAPHKQSIYKLIGDPAGTVSGIGAFNCVIPGGDGLAGANTDGEGFMEPLQAMAMVNTGRAVVIGSGGAACAILPQLAAYGLAITVLARDPQKAVAMLDALGLQGEVGKIGDPVGCATLLVNATPLGMKGFPELAFDLHGLAAETIVYDMVYDPLETSLLAAARARGLRVVDGLAMLVGQAARAFPLFFGEVAPRTCDAVLLERLKA